MSEPIRLNRDELAKVFKDFETLRQFELLLDTVDEVSNTTLISLQQDVDNNTDSIALKADIASPTFTGTVTIPTLDVTGSITVTGTVDGRNIAVDGVKLDGIEAGAEVNDVDSVAGKTGVVTLVKGDVGLGNVDNTSDVNKPVSTAQQTALDLKAPIASPSFTGTAKTEGDTFGIDTAKTPASASDTGTTGQIAWDADYLYVCTATDTWKRVAIATW